MGKIKNSRATLDPKEYVNEIEEALLEHDATSIRRHYEGTPRELVAIEFVLEIEGRYLPFQIQADVEGMELALQESGAATRYANEKQAKITVWANLRDWILAQLALVEMGQYSAGQVLLPFLYDENQDVVLADLLHENPERLLPEATESR